MIILGNEFFDALPVKQFSKSGDSWFEKYVFFNKKKHLSFVFKKAKLESIRRIEKIYNLKINKFIEYPPILEKLIKNISDLLKNKNSITAQYLSGEKEIKIPKKRMSRGIENIKIINSSENNLQIFLRK